MMRKSFLLAVVLALAAPAAFAHDYKAGAITINHPWARATPHGATVGAGYFSLTNAGTTPDPWEACTMLEYGGDRSLAWSVREQVIATPPESRAKMEERLLKALASPKCTEAGRAFLCQMLALVGSGKSATALAPLLREPKTAEAARYALQPIASTEVDAALREALGSLQGREKAGLIGTIMDIIWMMIEAEM